MNVSEYCRVCGAMIIAAAMASTTALGATTNLAQSAGPITSAYIGGKWIQQQEFKLAWSAVTTRANLKPLPYAELGKYTVYSVGPAGQSATRSVEKKLTSIKIKQPLCTTYQYAVSATDSSGAEGSKSTILIVATYCP